MNLIVSGKRKKAMSKVNFLRAYRNDDPLDFSRLVVVDENDECWDPSELLESLPVDEKSLTSEGHKNRLRKLQALDEAADRFHAGEEKTHG